MLVLSVSGCVFEDCLIVHSWLVGHRVGIMFMYGAGRIWIVFSF